VTETDSADRFVDGRISSHRSRDHVRPVAIVRAEGETWLAAQAEMGDDDPIWLLAQDVLTDGFGGLILAGPPGTSKSWYAARIAERLTGGDADRQRYVQFHPSYQYEDFVEGYVPDPKTSGFTSRPKILLEIADEARSVAESGVEGLFVLVIDELSRADPARVFGEALTYIEGTKRGL
jgi:5-methylcytosine-specific restriction enzyme B